MSRNDQNAEEEVILPQYDAKPDDSGTQTSWEYDDRRGIPIDLAGIRMKHNMFCLWKTMQLIMERGYRDS
eukprot:12403751-Karenia_brevis.AAC.1